MRLLLCLLGISFLLVSPVLALQKMQRYGIDYDDNLPQSKARECLASVIQAIDSRRIDYLLAHLADPEFVAMRVKIYRSNLNEQKAFQEMVKETTAKLADDPLAVKELKRFLKEGAWEEGDDAASVKLKDVKDRAVFLKKIEGRWVLENRKKVEAK